MRDPSLWRSLEELETAQRVEGRSIVEFSASRRDFLKLGAAAAALACGACTAPVEEIVPSVRATSSPGKEPRFFATALALGGYASGVLVETHEGRPTKIEGNPAHPASLGASDVFSQAAILGLWDPDRSRTVRRGGAIATRDAFEAALRDGLAPIAAQRGAGLRILTGYSGSPTFASAMRALLERFPEARWHCWEPLHHDLRFEGARMAFGRPLDAIHRLGDADVIVSVGADFLGQGPARLRYARDFVARRDPAAGRPMNRLHVVETTPTITGAMADRREPLAPAGLVRWLAELDAALRDGGGGTMPLVREAAADLLAHRGRALVLAGETLPAAAQACVHAMNDSLGAAANLVRYVEPPITAEPCVDSIRALVADMHAGKVSMLLVCGGNPVYDAPPDLELAAALARVPFTVHQGLYFDETAARCLWHAPQAHELEQWGDARAFDGTASVVQPVIAPLHGGLSPRELVALVAADATSSHEAVRATWRSAARGPFDDFWHAALRDGVVPESAAAVVHARARRVDLPTTASARVVCLTADESVHDGRFANNAWLQELPRAHSKITWDNAALVSARTASEIGVVTGEMVEMVANGRTIRAPAWVLPGQADDAVTLALGYGRERAGGVGNRVGVDAYALRSSATPWTVDAVSIRKASGHHRFATTQEHARMEGREPVRRVSAEEAAAGKPLHDETPAASLYPPWPYESYRWAMAIDLNACIGCNACTIACQAENNIPTVGAEEVSRGREMHWIRVDRYYEGDARNPRTHFQPVPCMQCENAPCEAVCPVGATVHDSEGINVQVYNRCVGTRFCSNNCPYKVRRFNFRHYAAGAGEAPLEGRNPEVTTRMRGVMEKCNYCLQRITRARIAAEREGRRIADGEVVTACQAACPTRAITFGDLNDPQAGINAVRRSPRGYALLAELNTRPRTTYLARILPP